MLAGAGHGLVVMRESISGTMRSGQQGFLEAGAGQYHMKSATLESRLQVVAQKIVSSSVYHLILMWLLRMFLFLLWIGKAILIWVLRFSFSLLRDCIRRYLSVALVGLTLCTVPDQTVEQIKWDVEEDTTQVEDDHLTPPSPLLPMVIKDRVRICEENLAIPDRERLLYEFDKIVAPQVSAFQLGEIIVPLADTRQLATFLKRKLYQACGSCQSAEAMSAAICGAVVNIIRSEGATSRCVQAWEKTHHMVVYIAARLEGGKVHLVLVGRKVDEFLGSSEFRSRFNPPRTRGDATEWHSWTSAHLRSLSESAVLSAEALLSLGPVRAQVW